MKIIICGAGKIGSTLTKHLSAEGYELIVVDTEPATLEGIIEKYDVMVVSGNCCIMSTLENAGVRDADIIVACTRSDEVNLLCCMTARTMNPGIYTVGRIRNPEYFAQLSEMGPNFALSMSINPERQAAREINRLLEYPGFLQREAFIKNRVEIVEFLIGHDSKLKGVALKDMDSIIKCKVLICTVVRDNEAITPDGDFVLMENDKIFVTAQTSELATLLKNLNIISKKTSRVLLAGGGKISFYLAKLLIKAGIYVKIIEIDEARCLELASRLPEADIIRGDATNSDVLDAESLSDYDAVVALTNMDEMNIIISVYAKERGLMNVITKVGRIGSIGIIERLSTGSAVCPQELCGNIIVTFARGVQNQSGAAITVHSIASGMEEASEFRVTSQVKHLGEPLKNIKIKKGVLIVGISHGIETEIPDGDSVLHENDTIVVVTNGTRKILQLNDIFE